MSVTPSPGGMCLRSPSRSWLMSEHRKIGFVRVRWPPLAHWCMIKYNKSGRIRHCAATRLMISHFPPFSLLLYCQKTSRPPLFAANLPGAPPFKKYESRKFSARNLSHRLISVEHFLCASQSLQVFTWENLSRMQGFLTHSAACSLDYVATSPCCLGSIVHR